MGMSGVSYLKAGHSIPSQPSLGRFLSRDPIGFAGGLNLYQYANSSPLRFVDPAGLQTGTAVDVIKMASDIARSYAARVSAAEAAAAAASAASDGPLPVGDAVALLILLRAMSGGHDLDPEALNNAFLGKHNAIQRPLWREIENRRRPLA